MRYKYNNLLSVTHWHGHGSRGGATAVEGRRERVRRVSEMEKWGDRRERQSSEVWQSVQMSVTRGEEDGRTLWGEAVWVEGILYHIQYSGWSHHRGWETPRCVNTQYIIQSCTETLSWAHDRGDRFWPHCIPTSITASFLLPAWELSGNLWPHPFNAAHGGPMGACLPATFWGQVQRFPMKWSTEVLPLPEVDMAD